MTGLGVVVSGLGAADFVSIPDPLLSAVSAVAVRHLQEHHMKEMSHAQAAVLGVAKEAEAATDGAGGGLACLVFLVLLLPTLLAML